MVVKKKYGLNLQYFLPPKAEFKIAIFFIILTGLISNKKCCMLHMKGLFYEAFSDIVDQIRLAQYKIF